MKLRTQKTLILVVATGLLMITGLWLAVLADLEREKKTTLNQVIKRLGMIGM